jgi:nicotinate-nucleotide adenylyltransferase
MKKIGVFGGVFNPPHNFHFTIAQEVLNSNQDFEKIIFVPTGNKYPKAQMIDAEHRYNMLNLICNKYPGFEVSRIEIDHEERLYAYQTLDLLSAMYPNHKIVLIIGSDNLKEFNTWKEYPYLFKKYTPIVYNRGTDSIENIINTYEFINEFRDFITKTNFPIYTNLNSSLIRSKIANKQPITYLVPSSIEKYIQENKLYL